MLLSCYYISRVLIYCIVLCGPWGSGDQDSSSNLFCCLMTQRADSLGAKWWLLSTLLIQSFHGLFLFAALRRKTMKSGPKWWGWITTSRGRRRSLRSWSWSWETWSVHGRTWRRKTRCLRRRLKNWPNPQAKPMPKPTRSHPAVHRHKTQLRESTGIAKQGQRQGLVSSRVLAPTAGRFGGRSPEVRGWFVLWNRKFQKCSSAFFFFFPSVFFNSSFSCPGYL